MRCDRCGNEYRTGAKFCPSCGNQLSSSSASTDGITDELHRLESELSGELDQAISSLDQEMDNVLSGSPTSTGPVDSPARQDFVGDQAIPLVHQQEWVALLKADPGEMRQSAGFVFDSPFIQGNSQYESRVEKVDFHYLPDEMVCNAFATDHPLKISEDVHVQPPAVVFFGGLATNIRLAAAALSAHIRSHRERARGSNPKTLSSHLKTIGATVAQGGGKLDQPTAVRLLVRNILPEISAEDDRFFSLARSYAAAMDMFVVAHEAGHIALGHTLGQQHNYDVSRNQEREADSFASSALSTSPFREYLFLGQVFVTIIFAWLQQAAKVGEATTHPLARERFLNALRSNSQAASEVAEEYGLTQEALCKMLPPE